MSEPENWQEIPAILEYWNGQRMYQYWSESLVRDPLEVHLSVSISVSLWITVMALTVVILAICVVSGLEDLRMVVQGQAAQRELSLNSPLFVKPARLPYKGSVLMLSICLSDTSKAAACTSNRRVLSVSSLSAKGMRSHT